ncbi:MAG: hypothetical protein GQ569_12910 [Methylococcaceae bacterium]|nr:hypothetical protein [Methylococcaceae bacterium]
MIKKTLRCVNGCGDMAVTLYEGVEIDTCPECKGVWLGNEELKHIISTEDEAWPEEEIAKVLEKTGKAGVPDDEIHREIPCPECSALMPATNYQYSSGIIINKCKNNHGVWLDEGELDKIQIYKEHWSHK